MSGRGPWYLPSFEICCSICLHACFFLFMFCRNVLLEALFLVLCNGNKFLFFFKTRHILSYWLIICDMFILCLCRSLWYVPLSVLWVIFRETSLLYRNYEYLCFRYLFPGALIFFPFWRLSGQYSAIFVIVRLPEGMYLSPPECRDVVEAWLLICIYRYGA